ncbi:hypothetical protein [Deinococcus sp. UYEF24]
MKFVDLSVLLHEARSRTGYRKQFMPLVERTMVEQPELAASECGLITSSQDVKDAAARLARSTAPHHTAEERESLALHLHAAAVATIQERQAKKAGNALQPRHLTRPAKLSPVDWLRISTEERKLINLIAASIIRGSVVDLDEPLEEQPLARQPKGDSLEQAMKTAGRRSYSWAKVAALELLNGNPDLALEYAKAMQEEELKYADAQRFLSTEPARLHTGRYHRGVIFKIGVGRSVTVASSEPGEVPIQRLVFDPFYFTLAIVWASDGFSLKVANTVEIEARSGVDVGEGGWSDFLGWLHHQDRRLTGTGGGRPVKDLKHLIYREHQGALKTRELIRDEYPGAIRVFEALRRTLTPAPHENLGMLSTFLERELAWEEDDDEELEGETA